MMSSAAPSAVLMLIFAAAHTASRPLLTACKHVQKVYKLHFLVFSDVLLGMTSKQYIYEQKNGLVYKNETFNYCIKTLRIAAKFIAIRAKYSSVLR